LIAGWIKETTAIKAAAETRLGVQPARSERMTEEQIAAVVEAFGGLLALLRDADPRDKAEIYARLDLRMIYRPASETIIAEVVSNDLDRGLNVCPRGDLNPHALYGH
jgi:site-specific DNA recombinase